MYDFANVEAKVGTGCDGYGDAIGVGVADGALKLRVSKDRKRVRTVR